MKIPIPSPGAISGIIDSLINKIDNRTSNMIRQLFFLLILGLVIAGIVMGYNRGRDSAAIKDAPLAERINDVFEYDIRKERGDGSFGSMLESELTSELKVSGHAKRQFPAREEIQPDTSQDILESPATMSKVQRGPSESEKNGLYEGTYDRTPMETPDVNVMKRDVKPETGGPVINRNEKLPPLDETKPVPQKNKPSAGRGKIMAPSGSGKPEPMDKTEILE